MGVRVKSLKPTEKAFMAQVVALARLLGWKVYHTHDSRRSAAGFPDLVMIRGTVLIAAELKMPGKKCTAAQGEWIEAFNGICGCVMSFIWTTDHWEQIETILRVEK